MKAVMILLVAASLALLATACGTQSAPPTATPVTRSASSGANAFEPQTSSAGNVTVVVTPQSLAPNAPLVFEVVMDTHSVDLSDDLTKVSLLRDDAGTAYKPTAWDGAGPGGHHRSGALKFAPLSRQPKSLTLVIKEVAGVPERIFRWQLAD